MMVPRTTTKGQKVGSGLISKNPHPFPNLIPSPKSVFLNGYAGDVGGVSSIPGSGRNAGKGNGNPLQYVCQENPMDKGAWWLQSIGLQTDHLCIPQIAGILLPLISL